jgi:hypothetical protein
VTLSPEFEARRGEAFDKLGAIIDEYRDVFGPHVEEDGTPSEIDAEGSWACTSFGVVCAWLRLDTPGPGDEMVRFVTPRTVSYPTRVGLASIAYDVAQ